MDVPLSPGPLEMVEVAAVEDQGGSATDTTSFTPPIVEDDAVLLALELMVGDDAGGTGDVVGNNRHTGLAVYPITRLCSFDF